MTDALPKRLLDLSDYFEPNDLSAAATCREAADRIARLEAVEGALGVLQSRAALYASNYLADERADVVNCWDEDHHRAVVELCEAIDGAVPHLKDQQP